MKKLFFPLLIALMITLTACSSTATGTAIGSTSSDLPIATELAVGTLKLAGTSQDMTVEQAQELVVYWQVYKELSQSETAAQAEVDALIAQIQETLTSDQMQAITDMQITQQDVMTSMQGITLVSSSTSDSALSVPSGSASGAGIAAGGPPDAGGAPPDGGMSADIGGGAPATSTDQSQSAQTGRGVTVTTGVPVALLQAVIQSLQQKLVA